MKKMVPDPLIHHMYEKELITKVECDDISACKVPADKNIKILDCLDSKDPSKVGMFLECLRETEQYYVADHLEEGLKDHQQPPQASSKRKSSVDAGESSGAPNQRWNSLESTGKRRKIEGSIIHILK